MANDLQSEVGQVDFSCTTDVEINLSDLNFVVTYA